MQRIPLIRMKVVSGVVAVLCVGMLGCQDTVGPEASDDPPYSGDADAGSTSTAQTDSGDATGSHTTATGVATDEQTTEDGTFDDTSSEDTTSATDGDECFGILVGDLSFSDRTDVTALECIQQVTGDVNIRYSTGIVDLRALSALRYIGGYLNIVGNASLASLDGLESVRVIRGGATIDSNPELVDMRALRDLDEIGGLNITRNDKLQRLMSPAQGVIFRPRFAPRMVDIVDNLVLEDLDGISSIGPSIGRLRIVDNANLTDISDLRSIIDGDSRIELTLQGNHSLTNLDGLENVVYARKIDIDDNRSLRDIWGLRRLRSVETLRLVGVRRLESLWPLFGLHVVSKLFELGGCSANGWPPASPEIESLDGLAGLREVGTLQVHGFPELASLEGLTGLESVDTLRVRNNPKLPASSVRALAERLNVETLDMCSNQADDVVCTACNVSANL